MKKAKNEMADKYRKYTIALKLPQVVYLLWGTDMSNDEDKLLLNGNDKILGFPSIEDLVMYVKNERTFFKDEENMVGWVNCVEAQKAYTYYDLVEINSILENGFIKDGFRKEDAMILVGFYNLFADYVYQLNQEHLYKLIDAKDLKIFFDYSYNNFFWKTKGEPLTNFNYQQFLQDYQRIIDYFREHLLILSDG